MQEIKTYNFNEDNLTQEEIDKKTTKVRAFIYNPATDEAIIVHYAGLYMLPGGKVDKSESLDEALSREVIEETGIEISSNVITPYLIINSYDKNYYDRKAGFINRHTETTFYIIETTSEIDETKKELTESEKNSNHTVKFVPLHSMKDLVISNDTTNEKRKQFDREILLAIDEFLKVIGYKETPPAQLLKKN